MKEKIIKIKIKAIRQCIREWESEIGLLNHYIQKAVEEIRELEEENSK